MERLTVFQALGRAWKLRWPFLASHLAFNILLTAFLAPTMAYTMRLVLKLSGEPALSDFDIAMFLLSPIGLVALLVVSGLALTLLVMNVSIMMSVALGARLEGGYHLGMGMGIVLARWRRIFNFAVRLTVRVLALAVPFVAVAGGIYLTWLTEYDINYYLSNRPPVFFAVVAGAGLSLALGGLLLLHKLLGWALALPLVIFSDVAPEASFGESRDRMRGNKKRLLGKLIVWGAVSVLALSVVLAGVGGVADMVIAGAEDDVRGLVQSLILFSLLLVTCNLIVTTLSTGTLAILLMDHAGWPDGQASQTSASPRKFAMILVVGAVVSLVLTGLGWAQFAKTHVADKVEVIAHRGAAGARPENTMASVEKALEDGANWVEIDVQETADGEVVVIHDSDFMKIGGDPTKIWDATMEDIERIDIGSWFDPAYAGQRVPTLAEVLRAARGRAGVLIELKYYGHDVKLEERVAGIVAAEEMENDVMAMSLKYGAVQKMKGIRPEWNVGLLASASAGRIWQLETDFLAVNKAMVSSRLVREMRKANKKLYVWTVNEPMEMSRMISLGVDGLITDEPAMARDVIAHRHELSTAERLVLAMANFVGLGRDEKKYRDVSP